MHNCSLLFCHETFNFRKISGYKRTWILLFCNYFLQVLVNFAPILKLSPYYYYFLQAIKGGIQESSSLLLSAILVRHDFRALDMKRKNTDPAGGNGKHRLVECQKCGQRVNSNMLNKHLLTHNAKLQCKYCKKEFRSDKLPRHEILCKSNVDESLCNRHTGIQEVLDTEESCQSVSGFFKSFLLPVSSPSSDYDGILKTVTEEAGQKLDVYLQKHPVKAQIVVLLSFYKNVLGEKVESEKVFRSICEPLVSGDNLSDFLRRASAYIKLEIDQYERLGSGWIFDKFKCAHLELAKYNPLAASGSVSVPKKVKNMRSVLNITSSDNKCFLYALAAGIMNSESSLPKKNADRSSNYVSRASKIDMGSIQFPVRIKDICKVEELNGISISVFEWCLEEECAIPLKHGSGIGVQVDLLYIQDDYTAHYLLIKDFNAFMRHRTKHHHSLFYCRKCLHGFVNQEQQRDHSIMCKQGINQIVRMPKPGVIEYKAIHKQEKKLFMLYFDFECLTTPYSFCKVNPAKSSTTKYQKHIPCSYTIVTTSEFSAYKEETIKFADPDPEKVTDNFITDMTQVFDRMMDCYEENQFPIHMSEEDEEIFKNSTNCHICKKALVWTSETNYPVRDHNHIKEKNNFRGAACNNCNRNYYERTRKVPAMAHNLKGYDLNLFLRDLAKRMDKIDIIPENIEKFKAVFTDSFIFLDSYAFLSTSLEKLADNLKKSGTEKFKRLKKEFPEHFHLLLDKGVYFYDYAKSYSVFSETELPPKEAFYSSLKEQGISDAEYDRAKHVYKETGCETLLDYMLLYVKQDAIILCDIFENFRNLCMEYYGLDCSHYMSLPGFSWDAMLKKTGVKLELITDVDMYTFIEENLRGGVTTVNHRHYKANNKYLDDYNPFLPSTFIQYIDANNLYGASMSMKLPTGNFRWLSKQDISEFNVPSTDSEGDTCFILEVDLEYPASLHDYHNDYPLAVERKSIRKEQLSPYNLDFLEVRKEKFTASRKLLPDLTDKRKYVCSLKNLQLYLNHGLILKDIHRVLAADQSDFVKPYIDFNSEKRQQAKSNFEKDFFKLANNSIYGKFIESLRNRTNVEVVKDETRARKLTSKPQFMGFQILDENITVVQTKKKTLTLNKPIACGFSVLENAKHIMGQFWYEVLKPMYGDRIRLLLSDTDSFIYGVHTEDAYQDLFNIKDFMDLSGYEESTVLGKYADPTNRKVPGKFSDEKPTEVIREVISLKPKMYSVLTKKLMCPRTARDDKHSCVSDCFEGGSITAKGISKTAQKGISHEDYRMVLDEKTTTMTTVKTIRSLNHNLYSINIRKRGLSCFDDKKYLLADGVSTLSYGHFRINEDM